MPRKSAEIEWLISWLQDRLGPDLVVIDHWDDEFAAGVALASDPQRLVYVAAKSPGYFVEFENVPEPASKQAYSRKGRLRCSGVEELLRALQGPLLLHLSDDQGESPAELFPCPCCGHYTYDQAGPGTYAICRICDWEDDPVQLENPDCEGGANFRSLNQASKNFRARERLPSGQLLFKQGSG
jgi:hypothetical protein